MEIFERSLESFLQDNWVFEREKGTILKNFQIAIKNAYLNEKKFVETLSK